MPAQTLELQAAEQLERVWQGSRFRVEKMTVFGKAPYPCDPAEEIQLDTNVYKGSFWQSFGISPRHNNSYESHAAHLNKYGMVSSVKTNTCHSKINSLFNRCTHSQAQDEANMGLNVYFLL